MNERRVSTMIVTLVAAAAVGYVVGAAQQAPVKAAVADALPADVYPDSRNRLPLPKRDQLDDAAKQLYDKISGDGRSPVGLQGPGGIRMYSPQLNAYEVQTSRYLRFDAGLDRRLAEITILVTARELDSDFEWNAHESIALKEGVDPAVIDAVRYRRPLDGLDPRSAALITLGREAIGNRKVSSKTFRTALQLLGPEKLVDYVTLMGQYADNSILLTVFDQQLPPGQPSRLAPKS
jgi:4-carboxymuconolactone decarboxylase